MTGQLALAIALHQLATVIWVGGMFFAHFALRGSVQTLEPRPRLELMVAVLRRFFRWVWLAMLTLWASGLWVFLGVYDGHVGGHVHAMSATALVMTGLFLWLWFVPWPRLKAQLQAGEIPAAAATMTLIRRIILTNLGLGLLTAALGSAGRYL